MKNYQLRVSLHEVSEDGSVQESKALKLNRSELLSADEADCVPIVLGKIYGEFVLDATPKENTTISNQ